MHPVYLDHAATTPMRSEVQEAMAPFLSETFGNPSSLHRWGRKASAALERARDLAAGALEADPGEILFTRGGTESDNLGVLGRCRAISQDGTVPTLAISSVEHHAVFDTARGAESRGELRLVTLPVHTDGTVDLAPLETALRNGPTVVSVMWVNNETGMVLPIPEIGRLVEEHGGTLHTDAVQAVGKIPVSAQLPGISLLTATGHKIYGPRGTGLLFVRDATEIAPLLYGGGQERALRPGTEDVAGAVGFATALRLAVDEQADEAMRLSVLRDTFEGRVLAEITDVRINVGGATRSPSISSLGIGGVDGQLLLNALDLEGIATSGGSACASGSTAGSHVISALFGSADTMATVRFSLGRHTTESDLVQTAAVLAQVVGRLRAMEKAS